MKIIDLLNKIANGEEVPKKIRIDHWCYKFEWKDYAGNYVDEHEDIDLMSALSCDKEELNYEVHEIEEEKKIPEKLRLSSHWFGTFEQEQKYRNERDDEISFKINDIIDYLDYLKNKGE